MKKNIHTLVSLASLLSFIFILSFLGTPTEEAHAALSKRIYLTSGTSWTVLSDWNSSDNSVEVIGSGGNGSNTGAAGGGGGAYAKKSNISLTPGASVTYQIAGGDGVFNSSATTCAGSPTPTVCAKAGVSGSGTTNGAGGAAASSIGDVTYDGGSGGGSAGGGSAGLHGAGVAGATDGGAGDAGFGGAGGFGAFFDTELSQCNNGENGGSGTEYDPNPGHGSGGGGGRGTVVHSCFAGAGGLYGGGAGGGTGVAAGGAGGLIIITYTSTDTGSTSVAKFKIKGGRFIVKGGRIKIR